MRVMSFRHKKKPLLTGMQELLSTFSRRFGRVPAVTSVDQDDDIIDFTRPANPAAAEPGDNHEERVRDAPVVASVWITEDVPPSFVRITDEKAKTSYVVPRSRASKARSLLSFRLFWILYHYHKFASNM